MSTEIVLASNQLAARLGVEKTHMLATIKAQCFRNMNPDAVSDTQLAAFVQIAQSLNLNPLLPGFLYAYPERNGGITPIIGPDGIFQMLTSNPEIEGWTVKHETIDGEKAATAVIKHKRLGDITKTVFLSEWKQGSNPNWTARPRHMLEIRALKQAARQIVHGIPFDEEERKIADEVNVTPEPSETAPAPAERPAPPARRGSAAAAKKAEAEPAGEVVAPAKEAAKSEAIEVEVVADKPAPVAPKVEEKPAPKAEPKPEPVAEKPAEPAKPVAAPDLSTVPEVCAGVSAVGFHGRNWPLIITATVNSVTDKPKAARPHKVVNVTSNAPAESTFDIVTFETVEGVTAEAVIEFSGEAKLRPGPVVDGKKTTDYTKPPAIIATGVKLAEVEF
jgi:RecT family